MNYKLQKIFLMIANKGYLNFMRDKPYIKLLFYVRMGKKLDFKYLKTFNEKLQYIKLYDRNPQYTQIVDKYDVKHYISDRIGEKYVIPTLGVWKHFDEINFNDLPDRFVLKCTHDSGGLVICKDKSQFDFESARQKIEKSLKLNYYYHGREWPYKNIKPRIIAEKYMTDSPDVDNFTDYKFFCFNGYVDCVMVCLDRNTGDTKFYFFNKDWELLRYNKRGIEAPEGFTIPKPECMDKMFDIASQLSQGIPFVRVDLYVSCGQIYFGEMTFYPASGFDPNLLPETDKHFGDLIDLSIVKKEK